jgi:hypothetical protein
MGENGEQLAMDSEERNDALRPEDATNDLNLRTKNIAQASWSALWRSTTTVSDFVFCHHVCLKEGKTASFFVCNRYF